MSKTTTDHATDTDRTADERATRDGDGLTDDARSFGEATLAEFGDSWKRPSGFADDARLLGVTPERCEKHVRTRQTATETRETRTVPPSEHEALREERVPFEDRYAEARSEFLDETVEFVREPERVDTCHACEGDGDVDCPQCTTGEVRCGTCGGDGMEQCSNCRGWGSKGGSGRITCPDCSGSGTRGYGEDETTCRGCRGDGHVMCNSCSGAGDHRCTTCGGGGIVTCGACGGSTRVTCGTCRGETELVTVEVGEVAFESDETTSGHSETGVPERFITTHPGTPFTTDDEWTDLEELDAETVVRETLERRHVDTTRVDYAYDGEEWSVYDVEGRIRAEGYPQSRGRALVPYLLGVLLLAAVAYGGYAYVL